MSVYPDLIATRSGNPKFADVVHSASASGAAASFSCGSFVRFELQVDADSKTIESIGFKSNGCGFMVAAADLLCEQLEGTRLTELQGGDAVWRYQGALDAEPHNYRIECEEIVREAFRDALSNYRIRTVDEFRGEKPLICTCFGIAEDTIVRFIETMQPADVDEVSDACNAGSGCGSCRMLIAELIDGTRR